MKTIGLLGGMSWESTAEYYRLINQLIKARLGGLHSAKVVLYSVDFAEVEALQRSGSWQRAAEMMIDGAKSLERAGAECLLLCTNTMHKTAPAVSASIPIPLIHIADGAARRASSEGFENVGLLGTRFTMEEEFYRARLEAHGLRVLTPRPRARAEIDRVIFEELCLGVFSDDSRDYFRRVVAALADEGARAVILGCTEIGLLLAPALSEVPLLDTTRLHAETAVEFSLG